MPNDALCFLEQNDFSLRFVRSSRQRPLCIEEMREVGIGDAAALAGLIPAGAKLVCALRPKSSLLQLATADEAKRHPGLAGMREFLRQAAPGPAQAAWFAAVQADHGATPAQAPWLLAGCSAADHQEAIARLQPLQPARCLSATLTTIGALADTATQTTLLLDIGEQTSQALLVGPHGVLAAGRITVNLDVIAEAVRIGLDLKFRGAAAKLFFNADYDFSEYSAPIAASVAAVLKPEITSLLANHPAPTALCCAGLPAAQQWFVTHLAAALGLATLQTPDVKIWAKTASVSFADPALEAGLSPAWFGFIHSINAQMLANPGSIAWHAEWLPLEETSAPATQATAVATPSPKTAPAVVKAEVKASAVIPVSAPTPKPAPTPAPAKTIPVSESSVDYPPKSAVPDSRPGSRGDNPPRQKKQPALIGAAVLVLALLGGGFFYLQSQKEEATRLALEKKSTELRLQAEAERARQSEEKARHEAESRKQFELEAVRKITAAETARAQAEAEARNQAAARLANARGTLVITTVPANATVTIGDLPPRPSPATFSYLPIGRYSVAVALPHYDAVQLEVEITENATTSPGPIALDRLVGSLELASEPANTSYEIRPAGAFTVSLDANRSGQTPATIENLDVGDYTVTFTRAGWPAHTENIAVRRNAATRVAWTFPTGSVRFTSTPAGAAVLREGMQLGLTPFTANLPPGAMRFEIGMPGFDPIPLSTRIEAGATQELSAQFPEAQRIYRADEVDRRPEPFKAAKPELPYYLTLANGRVEIQAVVTSEGALRDVRVLNTTEADLQKYCLSALAEWKFKPGLKDGKPVNTRLTIPFVFTATKS